MSETDVMDEVPAEDVSFYERPNIERQEIDVGKKVPIGIERVFKPELGIGGAYGTWGESINNRDLLAYVETRIGQAVPDDEKLSLYPLGFLHRQHIPVLSDSQHLDLEVQVGARFLSEAARACGWQPEEVDAVMIGVSGPVANDYTEQIAHAAGIREDALKVTVHKACDSSMSSLHMALNPELDDTRKLGIDLSGELFGRKVLVGGIEGLSRFLSQARDTNAWQLFGNGAGVIGVIPGKTMKFLVGKAREVFDEKGLLAVHMLYPHSHQILEGQSLVEATQTGAHSIRVAGMMHEPENGETVDMAGPMGMVKLFVRNGVQAVSDVYQVYRKRMEELELPDASIVTAIVHHANLKINRLKATQLAKEGIHLPMPWLITDFGNVSAASNMIAFLRKLPNLLPADHILFDGFGAGTYYDVFAVELGEA
jgi:3-Oxoacyl-[acyl-carrier-protein (ACP)] synthase III C terminal